MLLADAVLVIIVTSVVASSVVTLLTIIISGHLPVTSDLQVQQVTYESIQCR